MAEEAEQNSSWALRGRKRVLVAVAVLALLPAVAFVLGRRSMTPAEAIAAAAPPTPGLLTAPLEFGDLVPTDVYRAMVETPGVAISIPNSVGKVITEMNVSEGEELAEGAMIIELNDRPVIALVGRFPLVEKMGPGRNSVIVEELQESLGRLGYYQGETDGFFDLGVQRALRDLYVSLGYGTPGYEGLTTRLSEIHLVPEEVVFFASGQTRILSVPVELAAISDGGPVLTVASGDPLISVLVPTDNGPSVIVGAEVTIRTEFEDEIVGEILEVAEGSPSKRVWIAAPVSPDRETILVSFTGGQIVEDVLLAPAISIREDTSGVPYLWLVEGDRKTRVEITILGRSGGVVAIEAEGLAAGDRVQIGEEPTP